MYIHVAIIAYITDKDKTGHISTFFSKKPHCSTTMGK